MVTTESGRIVTTESELCSSGFVWSTPSDVELDGAEDEDDDEEDEGDVEDEEEDGEDDGDTEEDGMGGNDDGEEEDVELMGVAVALEDWLLWERELSNGQGERCWSSMELVDDDTLERNDSRLSDTVIGVVE